MQKVVSFVGPSRSALMGEATQRPNIVKLGPVIRYMYAPASGTCVVVLANVAPAVRCFHETDSRY